MYIICIIWAVQNSSHFAATENPCKKKAHEVNYSYVMPCGLVDSYQCFGDTLSLHAENGSETLVTIHKITGITTGDNYENLNCKNYKSNLNHS
jgi:hypothetical protein